MPPPVVYVAPHDSMRGVPFVAPMPPHVFFPAPDPQLHTKIVNQIDYYFRYSFPLLPDRQCDWLNLIHFFFFLASSTYLIVEMLTLIASHIRLLQ